MTQILRFVSLILRFWAVGLLLMAFVFAAVIMPSRTFDNRFPGTVVSYTPPAGGDKHTQGTVVVDCPTASGKKIRYTLSHAFSIKHRDGSPVSPVGSTITVGQWQSFVHVVAEPSRWATGIGFTLGSILMASLGGVLWVIGGRLNSVANKADAYDRMNPSTRLSP